MIQIDVTLKRPLFTLDVQLNITQRVTGLFGPSGSGKTTLLNTIAGLAKPDAGHIRVHGQTLFNHVQGINIPVHQRKIGLVFQDSRLFPHLTVRDNLCYGYKQLAPAQQALSLAAVSALLELDPLWPQRPHQLSGGEQQRVAIGRALLSAPRLLLLDEPLASLDDRLKMQILPFLTKIAAEIDIPMIYVSHDLQEMQQITQNIVLMAEGRLDNTAAKHSQKNSG